MKKFRKKQARVTVTRDDRAIMYDTRLGLDTEDKQFKAAAARASARVLFLAIGPGPRTLQVLLSALPTQMLTTWARAHLQQNA